MKSYQLATLLLLLVSISACKKDESVLNEENTLVFGHFYGECMGEECMETFVLTDDKLYEDTKDQYAPTSFDLVELDNDTYLAVRDLVDFLPDDLLQEEDQTFGCPDCADQGGLYIEYNDEGTSKKWRIDQSKSVVPAYLHEFMDKVNGKIALIND